VSDDLGREAVASIARVVGGSSSDGHQATLIADPRSS
jgi:hypothetical protein